MILMTTLFFSLILTVILVPIFSRLSIKMHAGIDIPDERKMHSVPVPRTGGIAIALGTVFPLLLWAPLDSLARGFLAGSAVLIAVGLTDDIRGVNYKIKFLGQAVAAVIAILYGGIRIHTLGGLLPGDAELAGGASFILTFVAIVGVTNAINLADGLDGLAGGISLLSFACIGFLAYIDQNFTICIMAVAMGGAIFGFLRFNTYPASLFMGDTGSQLLGFGAICLSLALTQGTTAISPLLPLLILGFPVLDTLTVMVERITQGRSPFSPDRNHFHYRLMRLGLYHTEAVIVIYLIQSGLILGSYFLRFYSEWVLLTGYLAFSGAVILSFHFADARGWKFKRFELIDTVVKGRLRLLRDQGVLIKVSFRIVEAGVPLVLILTCFESRVVPLQVGILALSLLGLLLAAMYMKKERSEQAIMLALYSLIPFVVYMGEADRRDWLGENFLIASNAAYAALTLFVVLTLKLTKRSKGFRTTPMDFLILFIALTVPFVLGLKLGDTAVGSISAKIIVLFFSLEVLIGELRGHVSRLASWTFLMLAIIGVRGITRLF